MHDLRNFFFDTQLVRVVQGPDGEPWFVGADVARVLGYANPQEAVRTHCKGVSKSLAPSSGGAQTVKIIPERDLYRLVMKSKLPAAERFESWVVGEVLPGLRKTGAYAMPAHSGPVQVLLSLSRTDALRLALHLSEERDALQIKATQQQATIATLEPKAQALDRISDATGNHCVTDAAKVLGMRPSDLFDWLSSHGWIYRRPSGSAWVAYQVRIDGGWLVNKVSTITRLGLPDKVVDRLLVTPKGLAHLGHLIRQAAS